MTDSSRPETDPANDQQETAGDGHVLLGDLTQYEDDGALVICDRANPQAWIRSDTVVDIER